MNPAPAPVPAPAPPSVAPKCPNEKCAKDIQDGYKFCPFCSHCLDGEVVRAVKAVLAVELKDREVLEQQLADAVTKRVWDRASLYGKFFVPFVLGLTAILALVGISDVRGLRTATEEAAKQVENSSSQAKSVIARAVEDANSQARAQTEEIKKRHDAVSAELDATDKRVKSLDVTAVVKQLETRAKAVDSKLDKLDQDVNGLRLTNREEDGLYAKLAGFRDYLHSAGVEAKENVPVYRTYSQGSGRTHWVRYRMGPDRLLIPAVGKALGADERLTRTAYTFHTLFKRLDPAHRASLYANYSSLGEPVWFAGPGEGLASYLYCSYLNEFVLSPPQDSSDPGGKAAVPAPGGKDLSGKGVKQPPAPRAAATTEFRQIAAVELKEGFLVELSDYYAIEYLWCQTFWSLRDGMGQEVADRLLLDVWAAQTDQVARMNHVQLARWWRDELVQRVRKVEGGKHVEVVTRVFAERGVTDVPP